MGQKIKIGIIGLGTVGSSVVKVLRKNSGLIEKRKGLKVEIKKAADVRDKRSVAGKAYTKNALDVINDPEIDIVVETMGGVGAAKKLVLAALDSGKHVVTSNKELIAKHAKEIFEAARENGVKVLFEASVCGGIPILHAIRECLAGNSIREIYGIVNGTTNYILTKMTDENLGFDEALCQAQKKGFAEADPSMDVNGDDAAYKAAILAMVAGGAYVPPSKVFHEGIAGVSAEDIEYAREIGYVIKLLAVIKLEGRQIEVRVHPTLIEKEHPLAKVSDNYNSVFVRSDAMGDGMFYGQGAGGLPTASAVISDVIEISAAVDPGSDCCSCGGFYPEMTEAQVRSMDEIRSKYYIRLEVPDTPGVLAGISGAFAKKKISIQDVVQRGSKGGVAQIVIILHKNREKDVQAALKAISKLSVVKRIRSVIRVGIS